ncbi:hypothetical protein QQS21_002866 [Conoideocrella luteorostrata]|uniref:Uncharacterized protein n=1 Tax=Conoideocrella luteorostrata TaxID=1105319 RepID=A0AAJ0CYJ0_9HYPO|nr:hypothetical protein QQS21_002866 [Conoideocrella luteorostrata]
MHTPLTFAADPDTDIWKKPPTHNVFTAPYRPHSTGPSLKFISATLTFIATSTHQFDQAGILLSFTKDSDRKWIKSGVELFNDAPRLSTVCTDNYSDWSVSDAPRGDEIRSGCKPVTITVERQEDELGLSLWVYHLDGSRKTPLREITWPFGTAGEGWELEVSAAIARPFKDTEDKLEATFQNFDVKWKN